VLKNYKFLTCGNAQGFLDLSCEICYGCFGIFLIMRTGLLETTARSLKRVMFFSHHAPAFSFFGDDQGLFFSGKGEI